MSLADAFTQIAMGFSAAAGAPFHAAKVITYGQPVIDDGGSIVTPGAITERTCMAQADVATDAMRQADGFADGDIRILIIGLSGTISTDDSITIIEGPYAGSWSVQSVSRDPAAVGHEIRGRRG